MQTPEELAAELLGLFSWLSSVGGLIVLERDGLVHVYRGSVHVIIPWTPENQAAELVKALREAKAEHERRVALP